MSGTPTWGSEWKRKNNGVQISNTICDCGFRFDESKLAGIKFGLKMLQNVLMCDNLKYLEKVLRVETGVWLFTEAVLPFLKMETTAAWQEQAKWYICISSKTNYILCSMFTITKAQLHVSALNVGHLQVVHEELINKLYQRVWGV